MVEPADGPVRDRFHSRILTADFRFHFSSAAHLLLIQESVPSPYRAAGPLGVADRIGPMRLRTAASTVLGDR